VCDFNARRKAEVFHTFYGLYDGYSIDEFTPKRREPKGQQVVVEREVIWNETLENAPDSLAKAEYKRSQMKGYRIIDFTNISHDDAEQMEEIHKTLTAAGVRRFTLSDTFNRCQSKMKFFTDRGWRITGMVNVADPTRVWRPGPDPAVLFERK